MTGQKITLDDVAEKVGCGALRANIVGIAVAALAAGYTFLAYNKLETLKEVGRQAPALHISYSTYESRVNAGYRAIIGGLSLSVLAMCATIPFDILKKRRKSIP